MMQRVVKRLPVLISVAFVLAQMSPDCSGSAPALASNTCASLQSGDRNPALRDLTNLGISTGTKENLALVCGVSVQYAFGGGILINIATSRPVPYQVKDVDASGKLIVDLAGARDALPHQEEVIQSSLVGRISVNQLSQSDPAMVRVTSELKGSPAYSVNTLSSGVRIEVRPAAEARKVLLPPVKSAEKPVKNSVTRKPQVASPAKKIASQPVASAEQPVKNPVSRKVEVASRKDKAPGPSIQIHKFPGLSASLARPALPAENSSKPSTQEQSTSPAFGNPDALARVYGISIKPDVGGATSIDIASTRAIPYRVFQLSDPYRLVVDMKNARDANARPVYPVGSDVLKRVRVGQWQDGSAAVPAVVRVVADLEGVPIFDVHAQEPGIRIDLRPREVISSLLRNPFAYAMPSKSKAAASPVPGTGAMTAGTATSPGAQASNGFASDLKAMGYLQQPGLERKAIISDSYQIYFVPEGGTFDRHFRLIAMTANAIEVEDTSTTQTAWLSFTP